MSFLELDYVFDLKFFLSILTWLHFRTECDQRSVISLCRDD